jgi:glycosyltransferase involved in cell wall biosynthesis
MKRRLLSISTLYPAPTRPGFGRFVARQMEALAARGDWDVTVINPIGLPPPPFSTLGRYKQLAAIPPLELGVVPVHHLRYPLIPRLSASINHFMITRAVLPLARRLHAEAPFDLVDAQFFFPDGPVAARVAAALGLPHAIKARGSDIHLWGENRMALAQMRSAARSAAAVLAVSGALAGDMDKLGLAPPGGITVHYTGLDHARFQPMPRAEARTQLAASLPALSLRPQDRLAVSVGALLPIKGQALAIEALTSLPADIQLALAGTGPHEAALRMRAAALGVASRVQFLGAVSHEALPVLLSAADVMVLPSEREGLANAWIEALACGTPLVIPPIGGAGEVVRCAAAGRLAERTPAAIAAAIADLLAAPPAQADVAACAARFSWDANAAALAAIYEKAASDA